MAGLLDILSSGGGSGGLLDFLRNNALNQQFQGLQPSDTAQYAPPPILPTASSPQAPAPQMAQASPLDGARWPFGPIGSPSQANPQLAGNAQPSPLDGAQWPYGPAGAPSQANASMQPLPSPASAPQPILAPQGAAPVSAPSSLPSAPGVGDRLTNSLQSFANSGGLIPALANGITSLVTGQRTDPEGIKTQQTQQTANRTAQALVAKGVPQDIAIAAVQPGNTELLKQLIDQKFGAQTLTSLGQGYVADRNGNVRRAYVPEQNDSYSVVQSGQDSMGNKTYELLNKATGESKPIGPAPSANQGGVGDMSKTGAAYLATVPPQQRGILQGMVDGTIQPPSSFALSKPYWQTMLAAAKNLDPTFDENTWAARHKMSTDMASSGNSSIGGILANGKSAFSHLADLSDSMSDLGNASHDFPGGGLVAGAQNYIGNKLGGSNTQAKIKAIQDNLGHYGQESTKFYSGTGGGQEERLNALKEMNPNSTSSEEMAAYLAKERDLMTARLQEKEDNIRQTMGEGYLQQHPVFTPKLKDTISRINANIAKLNGGSPAGNAAPANGAARPAVVTQNGHTYTLQPDGSYK